MKPNDPLALAAGGGDSAGRRASGGLCAGAEGVANRSDDCATARVTGVVFQAFRRSQRQARTYFAPSFHRICRSMPSTTGASRALRSSPAHQTPHLTFGGSRRHRIDVPALPQHIQQQTRDLLRIGRLGRLGRAWWRGGGSSAPRESSYRHTATACPRFMECS